MKIIITSKNLNASEHLKDTIESKFKKLDKYFTSDITAYITLSLEKGRQSIEATIEVKGTVFRAEDHVDDVYTGVDRVVDKLAGQMNKYRSKLIKKHKDGAGIDFSYTSDTDEDHEIEIVKKKLYALLPMNAEEAVLQMELVGHDFYVFQNMESGGVGVVYKRKDGKYGLLETTV